jgi:hypothetical protein
MKNEMLSIFDHKIIEENIKSYSDFWRFVESLQSFMKEKGKEIKITVKDSGTDSIEFSMNGGMYKEFKDRWEESLKEKTE